jgi:flavin-dependent thymidylate synthase
LSFTEKSQRYISIGSHYVLPPEAKTPELEAHFTSTIPLLFQTYAELTQAMAAHYLSEAGGDLTKTQQRDLENRAKEDTRYLLPLACETQMGMTMNARNVEHVVCELSDHPLQELRELSGAISEAVANLAPSLVKYTVRGDFPRKNRALLAQPRQTMPHEFEVVAGPLVRLLNHTPQGEERVLQALAFSGSARHWDTTDPANSPSHWREILRNIGPYDSTLREFELATLTFEAEVSASCFAQLKRHRMMTLLSQDYAINVGIVLPPSIRAQGHEAVFLQAIEQSLAAARAVYQVHPLLAPYLLTNAQRKRVVMHVNARELYHIARLRCDQHAQWEIRSLGEQMLAQAKLVWPNLFALACGKDKFTETYRDYFAGEA